MNGRITYPEYKILQGVQGFQHNPENSRHTFVQYIRSHKHRSPNHKGLIYMSTCLPVYLSTFLSVYISACLTFYLSSVYPSTCLPVYLSTYLYVNLSTYLLLSTSLPVFLSTHLPVYLLYIYLSTSLPVYLSTCLPVYLSTCLPVYLSTCLSIYPSTRLPVYQCLLYTLCRTGLMVWWEGTDTHYTPLNRKHSQNSKFKNNFNKDDFVYATCIRVCIVSSRTGFRGTSTGSGAASLITWRTALTAKSCISRRANTLLNIHSRSCSTISGIQ